MRKDSNHLLSITQLNDESIEEYMLRGEKQEIENCLILIAIEAFRQSVKHLDLFVELTKTVPYKMDENYGEAKIFIDLERE